MSENTGNQNKQTSDEGTVNDDKPLKKMEYLQFKIPSDHPRMGLKDFFEKFAHQMAVVESMKKRK